MEPLPKFVPVTVSVKTPPPATADGGLSDPIAGPTTANGLEAEMAVLEFRTVTFGVPAAASCAPLTAAVSEVALPYVVASSVEPQYTVEPPMKFVPAMVSVKSPLPAAAEAGVRPEIVGALATVKAAPTEFRPLALTTWMLAATGATISAAGTVAEQAVALLHEEVSGVVCVPAVQVTVDRAVNPVPAMATGRLVLPAPAEDGDRLLIAGAVL